MTLHLVLRIQRESAIVTFPISIIPRMIKQMERHRFPNPYPHPYRDHTLISVSLPVLIFPALAAPPPSPRSPFSGHCPQHPAPPHAVSLIDRTRSLHQIARPHHPPSSPESREARGGLARKDGAGSILQCVN